MLPCTQAEGTRNCWHRSLMTAMAGGRDQGHLHGRGDLVEGETSSIRTAPQRPSLPEAYPRPYPKSMGCCDNNPMADTVLRLYAP